MALIWKKVLFLTYYSHFRPIATKEKLQKIPSAHISLTYTCILLTLLPFFALLIMKKYELIR